MQVTVKLFGPQTQAIGQDHVTVDVNGDTITCIDLRKLLTKTHPVLSKTLDYCRLAINYQFADDNNTIKPTDEVALIGMVSGG